MTAANHSVNATLSMVDSTPDEPIEQHKPFSWYVAGPDNSNEIFIESARDAALGVEEIVGLLEADEISLDDGLPARLSRSTRGKLLRMVIATNRLIHIGADSCIDRTNELRKARGRD